MKGYVHIYWGDGKGKTTAAIGLAIRAAGRGLPVIVARFLKSDESGEVAVLKNISEIDLFPCEKHFGFYAKMTEEQKREAADTFGKLFENATVAACKAASSGPKAVAAPSALLILDEIIACCNHGLIPKERLMEFLKNRPEGLEVVLTGRKPWPELLKEADYVSEIRKGKHPFDKGVKARRGIEF